MKKFSLALLALAFGFNLAFAAQEKTIDVSQVDGGSDPSGFVGWVPNEFVVQLTRAATVNRLSNLQNRTSAAATVTGLAELTPLADAFEVDKFEKEFVDAVPQPIVSAKPDLSGYFIVRFNRGTLDEAMAAFAKNPLVDHVEPIGIHKVDFTPNDTYANPGQAFGYQWALEQSADHDVDAFTAWDIQKGSTNVVLAGLDTGVRYFHRDLGGDAWGTGPFGTGGTTTGNIWINATEKTGVAGVDDDGNGFVDDVVGYDFVTGVTGCAAGEDCSTIDNDPRDFNGHGTHTAGTMAAITNNARSVAGVAGGDAGGLPTGTGNGAKIMCLRIGWSDAFGNGFVNMAFAAQALNYAAAVNNSPGQTAKVVAANASWGSSNSGGILAAYQNAIAAGILFVKAAGNSNNSTADFLNARGGDSTMSVAATDSFDVKASFSSFGGWVDVSAPGVDIISTYHVSSDPANDYVAKSSGTSMSAPHTAGLAGLLKSQDGSLTRSQISSLIKNNTDNIDALNPSFVGLLGTGRINAQKALAAVAPPDATPPTVTVNIPNGGESWAIGTVQTITWTATDNVGVTSNEIRLDRGNDGVFEELIANVAGNPGSFNWSVTGPATPLAKVQVISRDAANNAGSDASNAVFSIVQPPDVTPPKVTVNAPNGGESWNIGTTQTITWTASDNVGVTSNEIRLDRGNDGVFEELIANVSGNPGSFNWSVTGPATTLAKVQVIARDAANNSGSDASNAVFSIVQPDVTPPTVTVNIPNGGESWNIGTVQTITWTATDNVGVTSNEIRLDRGNDGVFEELIANVSGNPGSFNWTVTGPATTLAKVQVIARDAANNAGSDASNAVFSIVQPPDVTPPSVTVNAPNGGENWQVGSIQNITWAATDNVGVTSVNIDYSTTGAGGPFTVIATSEVNDGTFPWTVPNTPSTNTFVRVTAFDAAGNSASDLSNAAFTISTPPPQQCDNFDDGDISNWLNNRGTWTTAAGLSGLAMKGNSNTTNARRTSPFGFFTNPVLDCDVRMNSGQSEGKARIIWAYVDGSNYRFVEGNDVNNRWRIYERVGGTNTVRLTVNQTINTAQWYHVTVTTTSGGNATMAVNGVTLGSFNFGSAPSGLVGCGFNRSNSDFDNFCVGTGGGSLAFELGGPGLEVLEKPAALPNAFSLGQNYPNPFNPTTTISFTLPEAVKVDLVVFNMLGQRVRTLASEVRSAGTHSVVFNGQDDRGLALPSGIYFYRLRTGVDVITKRMMFIK